MEFPFSYSYLFYYIKKPFKKIYQKLTRGFSDSEVYDLGYTIAKYALPRFQRYMKINNGINHVFFKVGNSKKELTQKQAEQNQKKILKDIEYYLIQTVAGQDGYKWGKGKYKKDERFFKGKEDFVKYYDTFWC